MGRDNIRFNSMFSIVGLPTEGLNKGGVSFERAIHERETAMKISEKRDLGGPFFQISLLSPSM